MASSSFSTVSAKAPPFVPPSTFFSKAPPFVPPNFNRSSIIGSPYYSLAKAPPFVPPYFNFNRSSIIGSPYYPSYDGLFDRGLLEFDRFPYSYYEGGVALELQCNFKDFQRVSVGPWKALFSEKVRQYDESKRVKFLQSRGIHPNAKICGESTSALSSHLSASTSASESCNPPSNSAADRYGASTTVITVDSSTAKIGLSNSRYESPLVEPIKLPESESIKHDNHMEDSSETVGQLDDVDSPCWKGTLAYRRSPFHFNEAVTPHLTSVQSVTEVNPYIPATDGDAKTTFYVENSENLISDETTKVSSIPHSEKSVGVSFSCLQKRSEYPDILESEGNCKGNQCVDIGREQRADLTKGNQIIPEVLWLDQGITGSSFNQPRIADDITMPESGHKDALQNRSSEIQSCDVDVTGHNVTFESHGAPGHSGQPSSAGEDTAN